MFKNLYRKIYLPIFLIALFLILFVDVFAVIVQVATLNEAYGNMGERRVHRILDSCLLYISSVSATAYNLSLDSELIKEIQSPTGQSMVSKLDSACNYALQINGITVYSCENGTFTSSMISQVPQLNQLKNIEELKDFFEGELTGAVSLRTKCIASSFNSNVYPEAMGIISCLQKIYADERVIGYVVADVLPSSLYSYIYNDEQFESTVAFISSGSGYFEYNDNAASAHLLNRENSKYFKYSATSDDGLLKITVFDSKKDYDSKIWLLSGVLAGISVILIITAHFIARYTAKGVTLRLDKLTQRMNEQELP